MIRLSILWALLAAICLAAGAPRTAAAPIDTSALQAGECPDMKSYYGTSHVVCGRLRVPESAGAAGRTIELAIVVITPDDEDAAKRPPTIFLHGGPGAGIVDSWVSMEGEPQVRANPFILFDQRGVGRSTPKVCPVTADDAKDAPSDDDDAKATARAVMKCAEKAAKANADLTAYGTDATVRDMEEIRRALHIDRWNVLGVSYGTTVALAYLAAHPDHTRAAVLDSVYPPEVHGLTSIVPEAIASLQKLNMLCAAQPRCRTRFGDIDAATEEATHALEEKPLRLSNAANGDERILSSATMFSFVQSLLMDAGNWYVIPEFINDVRNRRDSELVESVYDTFSGSGDDGGIWIATECRERAPFDQLHAGDDPKWPSLTRAAAPDIWLKACEKWPAKLQANWQTPREVIVPTLIIAGGLDPITPAADAQFTASRLGARARLLLLPYASHSASSSFPCIKSAITAFLKNPTGNLGQPCEHVNAPPEFAAQVVTFDINASPKAFLSALGVTEPDYWIWLATVALFSAFLWPVWAIRLGAGSGDPLWQRSSFWLSGSAAMLLLWASARNIPLANTDPAAAYWNYYGVPAQAWPAFSMIVPAIAAGLAGAAATSREILRESLRPLEILHRACVLAALSFAFATVLYDGAIPTSFGQLVDDANSLRHALGI